MIIKNHAFFVDVYQISNKEEELKYASFFTKQMQESYKWYGDVMFLDTTYNANKYKMPFVFCSIVDSDGKNQIVMVALLSDETKETYSKFLKDFKNIHKKLHQ